MVFIAGSLTGCKLKQSVLQSSLNTHTDTHSQCRVRLTQLTWRPHSTWRNVWREVKKKKGWEFSVERIWRGRATFKALFLTGTHFEPLHRQKHYNLKLVWQPCVCIFERLCEWLNRWLQKADWPAWQLWCQQPACGLFSFSNLPPSCKQHLLCSILCAYYVRHSKHESQKSKCMNSTQ